PVAGVEGERDPMQMVERGGAASMGGAILDVVHDERARVQQLHQQRERRGRCAAASGQLPGGADEPCAEGFPGALEKLTCRAEQGLFPDVRWHPDVLEPEEALERGAGELALEQLDERGNGGLGGSNGLVHETSAMDGGVEREARRERRAVATEKPRGGRPQRIWSRSPAVSSSP